MIISELWHYPIKGLAGAKLDSARLEAGRHFPGDRTYAITNGHPRQDEALSGHWVKKAFFLQMMTYEELAGFDCRFAGTRLTLLRDGVTLLDADLEEDSGIEAVNSWFARQFEGRLGGAPRLARVADGAFTDTKAPWISLGGTASVARFGEATGTRPDARRFRLNIMMETSTPFEEAALVGSRLRLGAAEMKVVAPVGRCAAIDVDPTTAIRGPHYLPLMEREFGHTVLGIFAEVTRSGLVRPGDRLTRLD